MEVSGLVVGAQGAAPLLGVDTLDTLEMRGITTLHLHYLGQLAIVLRQAKRMGPEEGGPPLTIPILFQERI